MNPLHNTLKEHRFTGAIFSTDRKYRYALWRWWDFSKQPILFIGVNPSRGHEFYNDQTLIRCINFAKRWGYGGMYFGNLFALRSPKTDLVRSTYLEDPRTAIGRDNDLWLTLMADDAAKVVCAWGSWDFIDKRKEYVIEILKNRSGPLHCFQVLKDGNPKHPLYNKSSAQLIVYPA